MGEWVSGPISSTPCFFYSPIHPFTCFLTIHQFTYSPTHPLFWVNACMKLLRILFHRQIQVSSQFPGKVNGDNYDKDCEHYRDHSGDFPDSKNEAAGQEQKFAAASGTLIILGFRYPGEQTLTPDSLKFSHLAGGTRASGMGPNHIIFRLQYKTS